MDLLEKELKLPKPRGEVTQTSTKRNSEVEINTQQNTEHENLTSSSPRIGADPRRQSATSMILFRLSSPPPSSGGGGLPPLKGGGLLGVALPLPHSLSTRECTKEANSKLCFVLQHFTLRDYNDR